MYFTTVKKMGGDSLAVQWLGLCFHRQGPGSVPGQGTKIPQPCGMDKKKQKTNPGKNSITESHFPIEQK